MSSIIRGSDNFDSGTVGSTAYGAVGTYIWAFTNSYSMTHNTSYSGSTLTVLGGITSSNSNVRQWTITSGAVSGTWRSLGGSNDLRSSAHRCVTLFVRIA